MQSAASPRAREHRFVTRPDASGGGPASAWEALQVRDQRCIQHPCAPRSAHTSLTCTQDARDAASRYCLSTRIKCSYRLVCAQNRYMTQNLTKPDRLPTKVLRPSALSAVAPHPAPKSRVTLKIIALAPLLLLPDSHHTTARNHSSSIRAHLLVPRLLTLTGITVARCRA